MERARCYAGLPSRLFAAAIDSALVSLAIFVAAVPVSLVIGPAVRINEFADSAAEAVSVDRAVAAFDAALAIGISALYFVASWCRRRATPGQRLCRLTVSDSTGATLTTRTA